MNDNVRKVFDILGVEPYEKFKIKDTRFQVLGAEEHIYCIDVDLYIREDDEGIICSDKSLCNLLNGRSKIVKLSKKKKLRDITEEEYKKWIRKNCHTIILKCEDCIFNNVCCSDKRAWINHKDLFSDKFLDQEIEVEE